jgi:hypothetical protein
LGGDLREQILNLNPDRYVASALHGDARDWRESNCYVDVWIEVLHAFGLDPYACLGSALRVDFEFDQWTFYKPSMADFDHLYGLRVEEMVVWRTVLEHCVTQIAHKRVPLIEVDAYFLPDTARSSYRNRHGKTSVAINSIDVSAKTMGYFHNTGYYRLAGDDFDGVFCLGRASQTNQLPPYCEIVKTDRLTRRPQAELVSVALEILPGHLAAAPVRNPFDAFAESLNDTVLWLMEQSEDVYHDYTFASLRQCGSAFELAACHLRWLSFQDGRAWIALAEQFEAISRVAKMIVLKVARITQRKSPQDLTADVSAMAGMWDQAFDALHAKLG